MVSGFDRSLELRCWGWFSRCLGRQLSNHVASRESSPQNILILDVRSDKIGKNAVDHFSTSLLVLKIFAFKFEKLVIWRPPSWYAKEGDMTSQLQEGKLRKYHFVLKL